MTTEAQRGPWRLALIFCVFLAACSKSTSYQPDAGHQARDASLADAGMLGMVDAASLPHATAAPIDPACVQPRPCPAGWFWSAPSCECAPQPETVNHECLEHTDCALMVRSCCGLCLPPKSLDEVRALPKENLSDTQPSQCQGVSCGQCYVTDPEPLDPLFTAGCVQHQCQLVNLRDADISACESDGDCEAVSRGCCPANSADPSEYVAVHKGADTSILACSPTPPCVPPTMHADPIAFCGRDKHCAVRRRETRDGKASSSCVSPNQNVDHAYEAAAVGCDCAPGSLPICRADTTGRAVGLTCPDNQYWKVTDVGGPCG